MHEYHMATPSLEGVLGRASMIYEGINRPLEVLRVLDGPSSRGGLKQKNLAEEKVLEQYFQDLYTVLMKKLSIFAMEPGCSPAETLKLQAMLQELIKIKGHLSKHLES